MKRSTLVWVLSAVGTLMGAGCAAAPSRSLMGVAGGVAAPVGVYPAAAETGSAERFDLPAVVAGPLAVAQIPADPVVAQVDGKPIEMAELQRALIEAYGLRVLLIEANLHLARQEAAKNKIAYTKADVDAELERFCKGAFKDTPATDYPTALAQLLEQKGVARVEFDMINETNTILRKMVEPQVAKSISDDNVRQAFDIRYGATVILRHIECANPQEALRAKNRLAAGEKFEDVARAVSLNRRTGPMGGELPPFSRATQEWPGMGKVPEAFKNWGFGAKPNDVSDVVEAEGRFHILKLDRKIDPKVVKFEDHKDALRAELEAALLQQGINQYRQGLAALAQQKIQINDPVLRGQFEAKMAEAKRQAEQQKSASDVRSEIMRRAAAATTQPKGGNEASPFRNLPGAPADGGAAPAAPGGGGPADRASPDPASGGERPPASKSAAPAGFAGSASDGKSSSK